MNTKKEMKTIKIPKELWKELSKMSIDDEVPIYKIVEKLLDDAKKR